MSRLLWVFILLLFSSSLLRASPGDETEDYQRCYKDCLTRVSDGFLSMPTVTFWTKRDECAYQCMWLMEETRIHLNRSPVKYFGKWPFKRWLGMQEPASALFSLANLTAHLLGFFGIYRRGVQPRARRRSWLLHWEIVLFASVAVVVWSASTFYHFRDVWWTVRIDYAAAFAWLILSLGFAISRAFSLRTKWQLAVNASLLLIVTIHTIYIYIVDLNYAASQFLCGAAAIIYSALLLGWSGWERLRKGLRPHVIYLVVAIMSTIFSAAILAVLDFSAWKGIIDAHATWHLITALIAPLFYVFFKKDALWDLNLQEKQENCEQI